MAKILYVITRLAVGGAPQVMFTAIRGLKEAGYEITLASGYPGEGEGSLVDEARALGVDLVFIPTLQREVHPVRDLRAFLQLWQIIRKGHFDVVHTHLSKAGILGRMAAFLARTRCVHTFHGDVLEGYFSPFKSKLFLMVERFVGRLTDRFVCVSENLKARLLPYGLGEPTHFYTIANCIDLERFQKKEGQALSGHRVGTLAMFYPIKRLDLFIEMAFQLKQRHRAVQCVLAGDGMSAVALKKRAQQLDDPVEFVGVCKDPAQFLAQLDVFVLCSDFESAGMSIMEAMGMGVPVVATAVGGIPEIVQDGQTGLLVEAGDVKALVEAVWTLLQDDKMRLEMGIRAQAYAQKHFSASHMIAELDTLYGELIS